MACYPVMDDGDGEPGSASVYTEIWRLFPSNPASPHLSAPHGLQSLGFRQQE